VIQPIASAVNNATRRCTGLDHAAAGLDEDARLRCKDGLSGRRGFSGFVISANGTPRDERVDINAAIAK